MEAGKLNLPKRFCHPVHPKNALFLCQYRHTFEIVSVRRTSCSICLNSFGHNDYFYACNTDCGDMFCDFMVDIACCSIKAGVDFRGHDHQLLAPFMWAFVDCHPIYSQRHEMTLTLTDTFLGGADPEDCWCDICEEPRDPAMCVYRSDDPPFTATIDCLLPQIVGALQGHHGEVELRTVRQHIPGIVHVTAQGSTKQESGVLAGDAEDVIVERKIEREAAGVENNGYLTFEGENAFDSLPPEDVELTKSAAAELERRGWSVEGMDGSTTFKFSDEAFKQFKEQAIVGAVNLSSLISIHKLEEKQRFVKVRGNPVLPEMVPLYLQLINKHGDFTAGSPLSPIGKALFLMVLLVLIQSTQGIQICEMTNDLLCTWQFCLEFMGGEVGFDVQFALDNLEKVARARYALNFVKARDDITKELTQRIKKLERDIPADKPKIEALREQYRRGKESAFVKQCLAEASALKWKNAGEFLGMDQEE